MSKYQFIISDLNSDLALAKLIGDIFGILNQLPDPSDSGIPILREIVEVLS